MSAAASQFSVSPAEPLTALTSVVRRRINEL